MEEIKQEKLKEEIRKVVVPYLKELIRLYRENLVSINLYGSATGEDFSPRTSDINLLVILKHLGFIELKRSLRLVARGRRKRIACPLFLTLEYIKRSVDVFPMEFLEMKENHICLYGEDVLANIEVEFAHLRIFCEEQIKGKFIRLRQAYLEIGLKKKEVEVLMKDALNVLIPVFRNLLRLKGVTPPISKEEVLLILSEKFGLEKDVFLAIWRDKKDDERIAGRDVEVYFERFLNQIEKLAITVDRL